VRKGLWPKLENYPTFAHKVQKIISPFVVCWPDFTSELCNAAAICNFKGIC
jgi:hypothetical protein